MKLKVAIVQHGINFGGRLNVIVHIIKYLNKLDIIPDILTFSMNGITKEDIFNYYCLKINYNFYEINRRITFPHDLNILHFNFILRRYKNKYDFFVDSNNTTYLMPHMPILSYVHFPRKYRMMSKYINIHDLERGEKGWLQGKRGALEKFTQTIYRLNRKNNASNFIICNSEFCKKCFKEAYPLNKKDISVIYPPVHVKLNKDYAIKEDIAITIGRFNKSKKQLEQIKIAEKLKNLHLHIIGFAEVNNVYYLECLEYVKSKNIENVFFHINAGHNEKRELLKRAKILLHTTENEPFGINIVEGIMEGCLPVVHDSGGQKESVFLDELRYTQIEEAVEIIQKIIEGKIDYLKNIKLLQNHVECYDQKNFIEQFDRIFKEFISENIRK